ncbi:MAG: UDP-glucose dehydrogenase family protein [Tepidisphaeraceae bacterium]
MNLTVYGLWHLGCVTAACCAGGGHRVVGLDLDEKVVADLTNGKAPLHEPGLDDLIAKSLSGKNLSFTTDPAVALRDADVLWVAFDTPVNDRDEADVAFVRQRLEAIAPHLRPGTLVLISSQVPVGFTGDLERDWANKQLHYAVSPENLRLGKAIDVFTKPDRVILGVRDESDKPRLAELLAPFTSDLVWMSVESAEMTKHALNAFLATSVTFINEVARVCEAVGADAKEVERGLKTEARIGPKAYLGPGAAFAGGTLARDLRFLQDLGSRQKVETPLVSGVLASNETHKAWLRRTVDRMLSSAPAGAPVAVLGLTYKPGTSTLRRSSAVELCQWLKSRGATPRAHDPAVNALPPELKGVIELCPTPREALRGAELAVLATEWPDYRSLGAEDFVSTMRRPRVIDQTWFLAGQLAGDPRIVYVATGRRA